jgi:hypothetical protein
MPKSKPAASTRTQVLRRAKEIGVDVLDHKNTLWLFCPAGKVFDFGDSNITIFFMSTGEIAANSCRKPLKTYIRSLSCSSFPLSRQKFPQRCLRTSGLTCHIITVLTPISSSSAKRLLKSLSLKPVPTLPANLSWLPFVEADKQCAKAISI